MTGETVLKLPGDTVNFLRLAYERALIAGEEKPNLVLVVSQRHIIAGLTQPGIYHVTRRHTGWINPNSVLKLLVSMDSKEGEQLVSEVFSTGEIRLKPSATGVAFSVNETSIKGRLVPKNDCIIYTEAVDGFNSERILEGRVSRTTLEVARILEEELGYVLLDQAGRLLSYMAFNIPPEASGLKLVESRSERVFLLPQVFSLIHDAASRLDRTGQLLLRITRMESEYSFSGKEYLLFLSLGNGDYLYLETVKPFNHKWMKATWNTEYITIKPDPLLASIVKAMLKGRGWRNPPVITTMGDMLVAGKVWTGSSWRVLVYERPVYNSESIREPVGVLVPDVLLKDVVARLVGIGIVPITRSVDCEVVDAIIGTITWLESNRLEPVLEKTLESPDMLSSLPLGDFNLAWLPGKISGIATSTTGPVKVTVYRDPASEKYIAIMSLPRERRIIATLMHCGKHARRG